MSEALERRHEVTRITCLVHQRLDARVTDCLRALGARTVLLENARCVRQRVRPHAFGLPGSRVELDNAPVEIFRTTVPQPAAARVLRALADAVDLRTPGRGAVYAQDLVELSPQEPPSIEPDSGMPGDLLRDFTLITAILSLPGRGQELAGIALKLGVAVPVVSLGEGTGLRDRMGLLRVTIPPEKELVHLMVPSHDAQGLQRLLIEEGRLDRPGGGFLYQTPVRAGIADPLVRIGRQEHAATMEQVIAAVDELKKGTEWRKRFVGFDRREGAAGRPVQAYREITFVCTEGRSPDLVRAAMRAGAQGATVSQVRRLSFSESEGGLAARERGVLCVPRAQEQAVVEALQRATSTCPDPMCRLQILDASGVFSHMRR